MTTSPRHEKVKEIAPQNAQKQQKNTTETKARNKAAKTTSLIPLAKMLQAPKKQKKNVKHQKKIIPNEKRTWDKPQKPSTPQKGKISSQGRPTLSQASCQRGNQKISVSI